MPESTTIGRTPRLLIAFRCDSVSVQRKWGLKRKLRAERSEPVCAALSAAALASVLVQEPAAGCGLGAGIENLSRALRGVGLFVNRIGGLTG